jgi:hypothetical protein
LYILKILKEARNAVETSEKIMFKEAKKQVEDSVKLMRYNAQAKTQEAVLKLKPTAQEDTRNAVLEMQKKSSLAKLLLQAILLPILYLLRLSLIWQN